MKKCSVGGQAVLDGVMMRSPSHSALAVRKESGELVTKKWKNKERKSKFLRLPVIRGVVSFVDMFVSGLSVMADAAKLSESADEQMEPNRFEKFVARKTGKSAMDVMMSFAIVIAIVLAVGLFFILPTVITNWVRGGIQNTLAINLIDGAIRIAIFLSYLLAVRCMKEIKQTFRYHGAEHKTVSCYEHGEELTVENVRKHRRLHPRCGTSYLLIVMVITIIVYSFFGWSDNIFLRFGIRLLMLPIIAGISYEVLKALGASNCLFARIIRWPGMQLQRLTTAEPTDDMIEAGIVAFQLALGELSDEEVEQLRKSYCREWAKSAEESKTTDQLQQHEEEQKPSGETPEMEGDALADEGQSISREMDR